LRLPGNKAHQDLVNIVRAEPRRIGAGDGNPATLADEPAGIRVHRFELEPEAPDPCQGAAVGIGDSARAGIGMEPVGESFAQRQYPSTQPIACFEYGDELSRLLQQQGGAESRQSGTDDRDMPFCAGGAVQPG
jgi:hypothetical protein